MTRTKRLADLQRADRSRRGTFSRLVLCGALVLALALASAPQSSAANSFQISASSGPPASVIGITGECFVGQAPGHEAVIRLTYADPKFEYVVTGQLPVHSDGLVDGDFTIPSNAAGGSYEISIRCVAGDTDGGGSTFAFDVTGVEPPAGPNVATFQLANNAVAAGDTFDVTGRCALFGAQAGGVLATLSAIDVRADSVVRAYPARESGTVEVSIGVPRTAPRGRYVLALTCKSGPATYGTHSFTVRVVARSEEPEAPELPNTGL